jgi:hypothetical protein
MLRKALKGVRYSSALFKENSALKLESKGLGTKDDLSVAMLLMQQRRAMSADADRLQQTKSVYVMNVEGKRTTAPLLIGLIDYFQRWLPNVGYFEVRRCHSPGSGAGLQYQTIMSVAEIACRVHRHAHRCQQMALACLSRCMACSPLLETPFPPIQAPVPHAMCSSCLQPLAYGYGATITHVRMSKHARTCIVHIGFSLWAEVPDLLT